MKTTSQSPTDFRVASTARWLSEALLPMRERVAAEPSDEAVERIRARVFGETHTRKRARRLAA
jgi:hypothetical protein